MKPSTRRLLGIIIVPLLAAAMFLQSRIDPYVADMNKGQKTDFAGLSNEFILGPLLGVQQAVAGLLWVRADEFFHEGDYDAILPIVRMVTWLDPHQLDVYITGAWHLAYNFTDASERSDRRYIPAAQKLLEEGDENNPLVYDICFEMGWQNIDKTKNFEKAEKWFRKGTTRMASDDKGRLTKPAPMFVWHQLAHSLAKLGRLDEAIEIWRKALVMTEKAVAANPTEWTLKNTRDTERHNLELTLKRRYSRAVHMIDFSLDRRTTAVDPATGEPTPRDAYLFVSQSQVDRKADEYRRAGVPTPALGVGQPRPPATQPEWDVAFDATPSFPEPKVLDVKGRFNVGDGARVTIRLHDASWHEAEARQVRFEVDDSVTLMQDQHSVRAGTWGRKIDMHKDPKMYGFTDDAFYVVFEFDPRATSPFIQDRFGWSGEGMTDKRYLYVDTSHATPARIVRKVYKVNRAQVMGTQPVTEADVVSNAAYAEAQRKAAAQAAAQAAP